MSSLAKCRKRPSCTRNSWVRRKHQVCTIGRVRYRRSICFNYLNLPQVPLRRSLQCREGSFLSDHLSSYIYTQQAYMEEGKSGFKMCRFELKVSHPIVNILYAYMITVGSVARCLSRSPFLALLRAKDPQTCFGLPLAAKHLRGGRSTIGARPKLLREPYSRGTRRSRAKRSCPRISVSRRSPPPTRFEDLVKKCLSSVFVHRPY